MVNVNRDMRAAMSAYQIIPELSTVELRHSIEAAGEVLPAGWRGTVLHAWDDGQHYLIEFTSPKSIVVDVERDDIRLATAFV
jgi:hypothetical protein